MSRRGIANASSLSAFAATVVTPVMCAVARIMLPHVQTLLAHPTRDASKHSLPLYA
ncbi:hypothetical protein BJG93_35070 [Paraburkholderia sprentiae WSM5005]|uniref:Uncharacterized protein n=1 Tax=Paraburkholderia sprentiae WSM5005 TaxID=754502 RepID=A0A8F4KIB6_9BURK|nr:hypothetical protein [Paraburkholderia sprentiae]QXE07205.1 hypothetical protein BJG93_35070 [Paraburkholderia sprentiae WSM5005]